MIVRLFIVTSLFSASATFLFGQCPGELGMTTQYGKIRYDLAMFIATVGKEFSIAHLCADPSGSPLDIDGMYMPEAVARGIGSCPLTICLNDGKARDVRIDFNSKSKYRRILKELSGLYGVSEITITGRQIRYAWRVTSENGSDISTGLYFDQDSGSGYCRQSVVD